VDVNLLDEFRRRFKGCVRVDARSREMAANDASLFELIPAAVAVPRSIAEVQKIVQFAHAHLLPLVARGSGTSTNGASLGASVVVDLSVHLRQIEWASDDHIRIQAGVPINQVLTMLKQRGRRIRLPFDQQQSSFGGTLAKSSTVPTWKSMQVIWNDGSIDSLSEADSPRRQAMQAELQAIPEQAEWRATRPWPRHADDRVGYRLTEALQNNQVDWAKLLIGSEGTLGWILEATLETTPIPSGKALAIFACDRIDAAIRAGIELRSFQPGECQLFDRRLLSLSHDEAAARWQWEGEAILWVEFEADSIPAVEALAQGASNWLTERLQLARLLELTTDPSRQAELEQVHQAITRRVHPMRAGPRPIRIVDELGIDPLQLQPFWSSLQGLLRDQEITACLRIQPMQGIVQLQPLLDPNQPEDISRLWPLTEAIHHLVWEFGGTISAGQGIGIARAPWVERQLGKSYTWQREVKRIFDPAGIFNPNKLVDLDASRPAWPMRTTTPTPLPDSSEPRPEDSFEVRIRQPLLLWDKTGIAAEAQRCNGCGTCRTEDPSKRMCPLFRVVHHESASPRAKANLVRLLEERDPTALASEDSRKIVDWCVNCKMCLSECPGEVNIPKLMLEAKARQFRDHGNSRTNWIMGHAESFAKLGSNFSRTANWMLNSFLARWILEKMIGLSRHRRMPSFARQNFLKLAKRKGWTDRTRVDALPPERRIAYFVDLFATYNDPSIAIATIQVLEHHGFGVYVPELQRGSGMDALAQGDLDRARDISQHNLKIFARLARDSFQIVCSEPTAALFLRHDLVDLIDDPDTHVVAEATSELTEFLWKLHQNGSLLTDMNPLPVSIGHHVPCHVKALHRGIHGPDLLRLIPQMQTETIDRSCSGMAGLYGMGKRQFAHSIAAGKPMLDALGAPAIRYGSTECGSCRMQMEHGTRKRTLHPIQWLAMAYRFLPELRKELTDSPL
jgi:Fe-S oxidoreductase/FAD/FMN-containing dehydrogenase